MIQAFINGYVSGFIMSLMLGTVFFALIQNSVDHGFKTGIYISAGVLLSDVIFITVALYGGSLIPSVQNNESIIRIIGAGVLLILGLSSWKSKMAVEFPQARAGTMFYFMGKGFLLNAVNPVNFFAWVSLGTYLNGVLHYNDSQTATYFVACLLAIFVTEVFIALGASKLRKIITVRALVLVNRAAASVFIIGAIIILWPVLKK